MNVPGNDPQTTCVRLAYRIEVRDARDRGDTGPSIYEVQLCEVNVDEEVIDCDGV